MIVLCLNDNPRLESAVRRFAERLGHEVHFHAESTSFQAQVAAQPPDLVVLDLALDQKRGIDTIAWLAQAQVRAPLVLLSGQGDDLLNAARRSAEASGIEVPGTVNTEQLFRDLPPLLARALRDTRQPPQAARSGLTPAALAQYIHERRIEPYFQAIVSPGNERLHGAKVLARLRLPSGEVLAAETIIPLAESAGLILPLTEALFARLIEYKAQLRPLNLGFLSVNLSATALDDQPPVALVRTLVLVRTLIDGLAGCCQLRVELTEAAAMADSQPIRDLTAQISLLITSRAMDGFGTGDSSIRTLTELPFDTVKIDLSFVADMFDSTKARRMLLAIIALGRGLGLKVVAEGIETPAQHQFLMEHGGELMQGHLFEHPMDINAFTQCCAKAATSTG